MVDVSVSKVHDGVLIETEEERPAYSKMYRVIEPVLTVFRETTLDGRIKPKIEARVVPLFEVSNYEAARKKCPRLLSC